MDEDVDIFRGTLHTDSDQSAIGCLQLFSNKSETSLSSGAFIFYPMNSTLLNFTEKTRPDHISNYLTVFAYLPIRFDSTQNDNESDSRGPYLGNKHKSGRVSIFRSLHHSVEYFMEPLSRCTLPGMSSLTADYFPIRLHMLLSSYLSDILDSEDMISVKRSVLTDSPCDNYLTLNQYLPFCTSSTGRFVIHTRAMLSALHSGDAVFRKRLNGALCCL